MLNGDKYYGVPHAVFFSCQCCSVFLTLCSQTLSLSAYSSLIAKAQVSYEYDRKCGIIFLYSLIFGWIL
jgi:hypothetical protein